MLSLRLHHERYVLLRRLVIKVLLAFSTVFIITTCSISNSRVLKATIRHFIKRHRVKIAPESLLTFFTYEIEEALTDFATTENFDEVLESEL